MGRPGLDAACARLCAGRPAGSPGCCRLHLAPGSATPRRRHRAARDRHRLDAQARAGRHGASWSPPPIPLAADAGLQVLRAGGTRGRCRHRRADGAGAGGAAVQRHRRRRLPAALGRHARCRPGTAARPRPPPPTSGCSCGADGQPLAFSEAVVGGRAVGVPGAVTHARSRRTGGTAACPGRDCSNRRSRWPSRASRSARACTRCCSPTPHLRRPTPGARAYFYRADGQPAPGGPPLRNPALAEVLRAIADARQRGAARRAGGGRHRRAACAAMPRPGPAERGRPGRPTRPSGASRSAPTGCAIYRVCGFPPPSSGHLAVMQILGMLERLPAPAPALQDGVPGADWLHAYTEAARLAFADRALYVADPDFVAAPGGDWTQPARRAPTCAARAR
ncbi:MAG: gamma-glutamyltransferase [Comamonadaceae bacterium]|nr:gamma-glutamyltransferase [Comamonadaceae bacterium]